MSLRHVWPVGSLAVVILVSCGDDDASPSADSGTDAGEIRDGGMIPADAGVDAADPDGGLEIDAGEDAMPPLDSGPADAGTDAMPAIDAGPGDAGEDAMPPLDSGPADAGTDAVPAVDAGPSDAGPPVCPTVNVRVTNDPAASTEPQLVWDGTGYGLAWTDTRDGNAETYFARLDGAGARMGSEVRVSNALGDSEGPVMVWTGSEYAITWYDLRDGNYEIYFARLDASGALLGSDVRITNHAARSWSPALAWTGTEYGIIWWEDRDAADELYFARVSAAGVKLGGDVRVTVGGDVSQSSIVWNGSSYGAAWSDSRHGGSEIYFARLDTMGARIGGEVRVTTATGSSGLPSIVWTGTQYGLGWEDSRSGAQELYFARLDAAGATVGAETALTRRLFTPWNLVWTGSGYGVGWTDSRDGNLEIYFARLDGSGARDGADERLTRDPALSRAPSVAWNGAGYGVVWGDLRDGNWEIYFTPVCP